MEYSKQKWYRGYFVLFFILFELKFVIDNYTYISVLSHKVLCWSLNPYTPQNLKINRKNKLFLQCPNPTGPLMANIT